MESIESAGANSSSAEFCSKLCSHADHIMQIIQKHFKNEETQVSFLLHRFGESTFFLLAKRIPYFIHLFTFSVLLSLKFCDTLWREMQLSC